MADITKINLNGTDYNVVDSAATSAIAGEIARAQGAESAITSALSAEVVARQSAITAVETTLSGKADQATTYTKTEVDTALAGKANTATTYTKTEVDTALAGKQNTLSAGTGIQISGDVISCTVDTGLYVVVQTLPAQPAAGNENKIHLVPLASSAQTTNDEYEEYLWTGSDWEYLGTKTIEVDLSDYYTSAQTDSAIATAVEGAVGEWIIETAGTVQDYLVQAGVITDDGEGNLGMVTVVTEDDMGSSLMSYFGDNDTTLEGVLGEAGLIDNGEMGDEFNIVQMAPREAVGDNIIEYGSVQQALEDAGLFEYDYDQSEYVVHTAITDANIEENITNLVSAEYDSSTETLVLTIPTPSV